MPETTPNSEPQRGFLSRLLWPGSIFVMLGGHLLLMASMVYMATSDGSFAVEPDYYQKGLQWDVTVAQRSENTRLGWSASIEIGDPDDKSELRPIMCRLTDKAGRQLDGATIDLVAFPHVRGNQRVPATLLPAGEGEYETNLRLDQQGVWEFRLVVNRGPDTFTDTQLLDVYLTGEDEPWRP